MTFYPTHPRRPTAEPPGRIEARAHAPRSIVGVLLLASALALSICASGGASSATHTASVPAYVTEPLTPEQQLIEQVGPEPERQ